MAKFSVGQRVIWIPSVVDVRGKVVLATPSVVTIRWDDGTRYTYSTEPGKTLDTHVAPLSVLDQIEESLRAASRVQDDSVRNSGLSAAPSHQCGPHSSAGGCDEEHQIEAASVQ